MCIGSGFGVRACMLFGPRPYPRYPWTERDGTRVIIEMTASPKWDMIRLAHRYTLFDIETRKSCQGNWNDIITAKEKGGRERGKPLKEKGKNRLIRST